MDGPLMPRAVTPWLTALSAYSAWLLEKAFVMLTGSYRKLQSAGMGDRPI
jgi:hypothetical protein